jgi:hypothetical protein
VKEELYKERKRNLELQRQMESVKKIGESQEGKDKKMK